jgi:hypothetical protein
MTVSIKDLVSTRLLGVPDTAQYTCEKTSAIIDKISVFNVSSTDSCTLSMFINKVGEMLNAPGVLMQKTIAPLAGYTCPEISGQGLVTGDRIVTATSAQLLIMRITGREVS